jgi:hypothetical protein
MTTSVELSLPDLTFLVALLEADRQTALQLLAAEHVYKPSLLPRLQKTRKALQRQTEASAG